MTIIGILLLLLLIFFSGFFSSAETALFSLSPTKIKAYYSSSNPKKRLVAQLVLKPRDLLVTVFMLNTLVNILIQNTTSFMVGETAGWLFKIALPFGIMLVFGEIIPKHIGLQNNVALANFVAPTINFLQYFLQPIRRFTIGVTEPISRCLFFFLRKEATISREELRHVLTTSEEKGVVHADEAELLWGYANLQDATVKQIMWPREDIIYYDINEPISKLLHLLVDKECSRLPVCNHSLDDIQGIIQAQDFFLHRNKLSHGHQLRPYLKKPLYVPENMPAPQLTKHFSETNQVLALVVDEYGSLSGLIAYEDLIEEIIGEISDLRDVKKLYTRSGNDEIITAGKLELDEFNTIFQSNLTSENQMVTIGGWLMEQLGEIPKSGSKFELHGFLFQVLAANPNRIQRLYIRQLSKKRGGL